VDVMALDTPVPNSAGVNESTVEKVKKPHYDPATAITFLIAGLGLGSVLTLLFASRFDQYSLLAPGPAPHSAR
jgi:hypothetical protein